jgi:hypothetical protein
MVEVHDQFLGLGIALASKDVPLLNLLFFKPPVHVHHHFATYQFGLAGAAHAALAGKRKIGPLGKGRIQDRHFFLQGDIDSYLSAI